MPLELALGKRISELVTIQTGRRETDKSVLFGKNSKELTFPNKIRSSTVEWN